MTQQNTHAARTGIGAYARVRPANKVYSRSMPRRTNAFQGLIYRIQRTAASGAVVTESKVLADSLTGALVEVDVVVEQDLGGHAIIVGVECTAEARAATVEWVNEMHAKHATLPTHHLVLVSRAGFSNGARRRAAGFQIAAYTLAEAVEGDWTTIVGRLHTVWLARLDAKLSGCQAIIALAGEADAACDVPPNVSVHRSDKSVIGTVREIGEAALRLEDCREHLLRTQTADGRHELTFKVNLPTGSYIIDAEQRQHYVRRLVFSLVMERDSAPVPLTDGQVGPWAFAMGEEATLFGPAAVTIVEQAGQPAATTLAIRDERGTVQLHEGRAPLRKTDKR